MAPSRVGWGILGASWIGGRAVLPAITASRNGRLIAIASSDPERARLQAREHGVARALGSYEEVLADPEVHAVYVPLANHLHRQWTIAALEAGKHVLCEKPLALTLAEGEAMAAAAASSGQLLMEAFMYRFHPRMRALREAAGDVRFLHAAFGFPMTKAGNYRLEREFGGGALLDVGVYTIDVARWFLGEPESAAAVAHETDVDMTVTMSLAFPGARHAALWCSFESPEHQELVLVGPERTHLPRPFTSWRDPEDQYQLMVEAFADAVLAERSEAPLPISSSLANLRAVEMVRAAISRT